MSEKLKNVLTDEELENVIGGSYVNDGLDLVKLRAVPDGYKYCTTCEKSVIPTTNTDGIPCCPDCGMLLNVELNKVLR